LSDYPVAAIAGETTHDSGEQALVERACGDPSAFALLYRRYYNDVAGYVHRRLGDRHATEDVVAEVFLAVIRSLGRYRHRGLPFRAWLFRIATNSVNRWLRRNRRRTSAVLAEQAATAVSAHSPEDRAEADIALKAMLALSPKHQTVLSLHYLEGLSVEDVAMIVGCRVGTVKSRLSRARQALQRELLRRR
jgi:RNA polymerase sigma-70 factor (ECF subfamily)